MLCTGYSFTKYNSSLDRKIRVGTITGMINTNLPIIDQLNQLPGFDTNASLGLVKKI